MLSVAGKVWGVPSFSTGRRLQNQGFVSQKKKKSGLRSWRLTYAWHCLLLQACATAAGVSLCKWEGSWACAWKRACPQPSAALGRLPMVPGRGACLPRPAGGWVVWFGGAGLLPSTPGYTKDHIYRKCVCVCVGLPTWILDGTDRKWRKQPPGCRQWPGEARPGCPATRPGPATYL